MLNKSSRGVPPGFKGDFSLYSCVIPGMTKASAVGFMMSIVIATAIVSSRPIWARLIGASSMAWMRKLTGPPIPRADALG